jgi:hypothetical protein
LGQIGRTKGAFVEDDQTKSVMLGRRDGITIRLHQSISFIDTVKPENFISLRDITLMRVCSLGSVNLAEIGEFVGIVHQAKGEAKRTV